MKRKTGTYRTGSTAGETYSAFIPAPLPPSPPLRLTGQHHDLLEKASRALGRLDGMTLLLPDTSLFLYFYVRKEALLSSQIEGTQSSLNDLLLYESDEMPEVPLEDVQEVSNYVAAMNYGLERLRDGFPISLRLIREIHAILLSKGRGSNKEPGEFRRSQNWVGGSRPGNAVFVPPPPESLLDCLGPLEKFLHNDPAVTPLLIKAALAHVQFETIHPFLDGNGRVGRLLITLLMCAEGALGEPILYLSLYFKTNRREYYEWLQKVRTEGDWEGWLSFFLTGVMDCADQATQSATQILKLFESDSAKIQSLKKAAGSALRVYQLMRTKPLLPIPHAAKALNLTVPTITQSLENLHGLGIVREITGKKRGRIFAYSEYLHILSQGTQPIR
ncbi:MAG: Fic family protein [Syntrophobacteraceae bacterium]